MLETPTGGNTLEFTSLWFVTLFLPCSLLIYAVTPQKGKNLVLLLLSLLFYSQLEVFYLFFYAGLCHHRLSALPADAAL